MKLSLAVVGVAVLVAILVHQLGMNPFIGMATLLIALGAFLTQKLIEE